jgi:VanZ family protein
MPTGRRLLAAWAALPAAARWAVVIAQAGFVWWSSSQPPPTGGVTTTRSMLHNSAHVLVHAVIGAAVLVALRGSLPWRRADALRAVLIASAHGAVDEWHQTCVAGRVGSVADFAADVAGAAIGVLLLLQWTAGGRARRALPLAVAAALAAVALATWTPW